MSAKTKIMLVGIDGLILRLALESERAPALKSLKDAAYFSEMTIDPPTWSGPSWSTILTGTTQAQHGVIDNTFAGHRLLHFPDLLSRAYYQDQSTTTFAAAGWPPLVDPSGHGPVIQERREQQLAYRHRVIARDGETFGYKAIDGEIADAALYAIENAGPDVSFVYFCGVDEAGHVHGAIGTQYLDAIGRVDAHLARIESALRRRAVHEGEKWLLVITTDHGHLDEGGHGGDSPQERASFVIAAGIGRQDPQWERPVRPEELTPLLLAEREFAG